MGKDVPFVPVAMQHGATEDVLLWQKCALFATEVRAVRNKDVRNKGVRSVRQRCALFATRVRVVRVFTTDRERLPCGKMVRII